MKKRTTSGTGWKVFITLFSTVIVLVGLAFLLDDQPIKKVPTQTVQSKNSAPAITQKSVPPVDEAELAALRAEIQLKMEPLVASSEGIVYSIRLDPTLSEEVINQFRVVVSDSWEKSSKKGKKAFFERLHQSMDDIMSMHQFYERGGSEKEVAIAIINQSGRELGNVSNKGKIIFSS